MENEHTETPYRWYILTLAALTHTVAAAMPLLCLPVLFKEISKDLGLSLVQVGMIWGIMGFPILLTSLAGGTISDRFGTRRTLTIACTVVGLAGALRGLSYDLTTLGGTVFLFGMLRSVIPMTVHKTCGVWFSRRQLGLANGVVSMGMALGFMAGSMLSATVLSPWLGGWRNVLVVYGVLSIALSIPWYFTRPHADDVRPRADGEPVRSLYQGILYVGRMRNIWLLGITILGIGGGIQGMLGYLPLYLRTVGWSETNADGAAALFHGVSMIFAIPFAFWSDRFGSRKLMLMIAALMITTGIGLLSIAGGLMVWVAVIVAGLVRDGFMAIFMTMIVEIKGVGKAHSGTAMGLVTSFMGMGNLIAPPLGNSLGVIAPGTPFLCWMALGIMGFVSLCFFKEERSETDRP